MARDAGGSGVTRRSRRLRGKRSHHGRSAYRHLAAGTPHHAPAMRDVVAHAAAGEAAREWRPHAMNPHRKALRPGTMLASLGHELLLPMPQDQPSLSGVPIRWVASSDCLAMPLRTVLVELAQAFGQLRVNSTCRSPRHNAKVGGAKHSFHLTGHAADFRVSSSPSAVLAFLRARGDVGGLKHYGGGLFHIDTGPRRSW
jgi:Peptidase M15